MCPRDMLSVSASNTQSLMEEKQLGMWLLPQNLSLGIVNINFGKVVCTSLSDFDQLTFMPTLHLL